VPAVAQALDQERVTAFDYVMSNGGVSYNGAGSSQQQQQASAATSNASEVGSRGW
jgi:hypothetical protein